MLKLKSTACIDASQNKTWKVLADLENISLWSEAVLSAECQGSEDYGVGTERSCSLGKNVTIKERWIAWEEGKSYTYEGFDLPLVKSAKNTWLLEAKNGKTLLTTNAEIVLKGGIFGKLLEPLMLYMSKKISANALSAFKYLVENGKPYQGKHSSLSRAPASC